MKKIEHLYLWYPLTNLVELDNKKIFFKIPKDISPYIELNTESINTLLEDDQEIEVNPLLRFPNIFHKLGSPDALNKNKKLNEFTTNLVYHYLGKIDLYTGQNKKDIMVKEIVRNIKKGSFGSESSKLFESFKEFEKYMVADVICAMYQGLGMIDAFKKAVKLVFNGSIVYDKKTSSTNLVVFLNAPNTEDGHNENKVKFMKETFLPLGLELNLFWDKHFGVVGADVTLKIGEIAVF